MALDLDLSGRHALVCGASRGIGRAAALELAGLGASVSVLARNEAALAALLPELRAAGAPQARPVVADLDHREALAARLEALLAAHGPVHIWVNNAGGPPGGRLLDAEPDALLAAFSRHVLASQTLLRLLVPGMADAGYGRIVNVISTSVREPIPNLGVSNTVRGAVASWAKTLSRELPPGVTINNILPGFTDTARLGELRKGIAAREGIDEQAVVARWLADVPEGRLGRAEELAGVIAFLASPAGAFVRGQSIAVDGGRLRSI